MKTARTLRYLDSQWEFIPPPGFRTEKIFDIEKHLRTHSISNPEVDGLQQQKISSF